LKITESSNFDQTFEAAAMDNSFEGIRADNSLMDSSKRKTEPPKMETKVANI
jgi:hypothetical protein